MKLLDDKIGQEYEEKSSRMQANIERSSQVIEFIKKKSSEMKEMVSSCSQDKRYSSPSNARETKLQSGITGPGSRIDFRWQS